jgi:hypothetical protein
MSAYRVVVIPIFGHDKLGTVVPYLAQQKGAFDEVQLWINTLSADSVSRCRATALAWPWVTVVPPASAVGGATVLASFYDQCRAPDAVYVQLHEDVVWLSDAFVDAMCAACDAAPDATCHAPAINHPGLALSPDAALRAHRDFLRGKTPVASAAGPATPATPPACAWKGSADRNGPRVVVDRGWCSFLCTPAQRTAVERSEVVQGYAAMAPPTVDAVAAYARGRAAL